MAICGIGTIAEIRPKAMKSPAIGRPYCGTVIPELSLEKLASGIDEAARIRSGGAVVAGERRGRWTRRCISKGDVGSGGCDCR